MFDRELILNGKPVRSPEQQVYANMKDIEELQKIIKKAYYCDTELNSSSVSITRTNTNANNGEKEGWLFDTVGNLFQITGGDEDNLLLQFYTCFRGEQGEQGPEGPSGGAEIDDSTTSATKVWSSQKTSQEITSNLANLVDDSSVSLTKTWSSNKINNLLTKTLLWENLTPNASFGETEITLNETLQVGDVVCIEWIQSANAPLTYYSFFKIKAFSNSETICCMFLNAYYGGTMYSVSRQVKMTVGNKLNFQHNYANTSQDDTTCIPLRVYKVNNFGI